MSDVVNSREEDDIIPGNVPLRPPEGTTTAFHSTPCAVSPAASTAWGEDSDDELIRRTPAHSPLPFGATDHHHDAAGNTTGNPASASWANDSSSSDGQSRTTATRLPSGTLHSYQRVVASRGPGVSTAWGDDSDDNDDGRRNNHRDDDIERRSVTLSASSGLLMAAVAIDDKEEAPAVQRREEHTDTVWGSDDDGEHVYDYRPSRFSQPFGMGAAAAAAAAGVAPTGADMAPASHATTSWGCDGEYEDNNVGEQSSPFSQSLRTGGGGACATAAAGGVNPQQPLSPARYYHHRHDSDEVVVAPLWVPHAQGQTGPGEPDDLWADEGDGRSGDTSRPRGNGNNPNGLVAWGLRGPGLSATLPALDDVDLTAENENNSPEVADLAATVPAGRISTPLTMTPSPWFNASRRDFARQSSAGGNDDDKGRCNPHDLRSTSTPPRVGGGAWFGRWFTSNVPRPWRPPGAAESSPVHEARAANYDVASKPQRPVIPPVRDRRRSWLQRPSAFVARLRRRAVRELGPPRTPGGGLGAKQDDDGSGVRAWGWWDNLRNAPGLIGRLAVCILAVCALWSTSLSVVGEDLAFSWRCDVRTV